MLEVPALPDGGECLGITQEQMGSVKPRVSTATECSLDLGSNSASIFPWL